MAAQLQGRNIRSDKWLSGLVDAMEDISAADDICRATNPAVFGRVLEQLQSGSPERSARKQAYLA